MLAGVELNADRGGANKRTWVQTCHGESERNSRFRERKRAREEGREKGGEGGSKPRTPRPNTLNLQPGLRKCILATREFLSPSIPKPRSF